MDKKANRDVAKERVIIPTFFKYAKTFKILKRRYGIEENVRIEV